MAHKLVLYHYWRSSSSWRVRWALALKGLEYTSVTVNLLEKEHKTEEFLQRSPLGFVPCLEVDGQPFCESLSIIEWLEEEYPQKPILPNSSLNRMKVRQLSLVIAAATQPLQNLSAQRYFSDDAEKRKEYAHHWISQGLIAYEKLLPQVVGKCSFGDQVSLADLCLIPQCYNAVRFGVDLAQYPHINAINKYCLTTPECEAAAPHNQPGAK